MITRFPSYMWLVFGIFILLLGISFSTTPLLRSSSLISVLFWYTGIEYNFVLKYMGWFIENEGITSGYTTVRTDCPLTVHMNCPYLSGKGRAYQPCSNACWKPVKSDLIRATRAVVCLRVYWSPHTQKSCFLALLCFLHSSKPIFWDAPWALVWVIRITHSKMVTAWLLNTQHFNCLWVSALTITP